MKNEKCSAHKKCALVQNHPRKVENYLYYPNETKSGYRFDSRRRCRAQTTLKSQNHKITFLVKLLIVNIKKCLALWQSTFFKHNFELFYRKSAHKKQKFDTFVQKSTVFWRFTVPCESIYIVAQSEDASCQQEGLCYVVEKPRGYILNVDDLICHKPDARHYQRHRADVLCFLVPVHYSIDCAPAPRMAAMT